MSTVYTIQEAISVVRSTLGIFVNDPIISNLITSIGMGCLDPCGHDCYGVNCSALERDDFQYVMAELLADYTAQAELN